MKPPNMLTDTELLQCAEEHLLYEIDMLIWSAGILAYLAGHKTEGYLAWAMNNGLLNTFTLHARNLINFLYSRPRGSEYATDVVLEDYVGDQVAASNRPQITPLLEQALKKANKQAAHLSIDRLQYEKAGKEWEFIELSKQILAAFMGVAPHIPDSRMSEGLRQRLAQSGFRIPIVDISIGRSPAGDPISVNFSLRISRDGKSIEGISA
jgi:hypothetical protein